MLFESNGRPLLFYIPKSDTLRDKYIQLIGDNGGIVVENQPNSSNKIIPVCSYKQVGYYRSDFISDSVNMMQLVNIQDYLYTDDTVPQSELNKRKRDGKRNVNRYTNEQDEFILERVRMDPEQRGSQKFYEALAKEEILSNHSADSIRSRFRSHLKPMLQYIYQRDERGNLISDINGNLLKMGLENLPDRKRKFTADDDYLLCTRILEWARENHLKKQHESEGKSVSPLDLNDPKPPVSFFVHTMRKFPEHSEASWRDRYRKFASKYGVAKYVQDFDDARKNNKPFSEMKNLSRRYVRDPTRDLEKFKQLIGFNEKPRALDVPSQPLIPVLQELTEEDLENAQIDEVLSKRPKIDLPVLGEDVDYEEEVVEEEEDDENKNGENGVEEENNDIEEYTNANLTNEENIIKNEDSLIIPDTQLEYGLQYINSSHVSEQLIDLSFFDSPDIKTRLLEQCDKFDGVSSGKIFEGFRSFGILPPLTSHILRSTGGDVYRIKQFTENWIDRLRANPTLYDHPLTLFTIYDVRGIWNAQYDKMLLKNAKDKELINIHGKLLMKQRLQFLHAID